jgi:tRNA G10  N-methylase Trm11
MAMLAELDRADLVLDPCCGSGTIAIETALLMRGTGAVVASDIDAQAVRVTRRNATEGAHVHVSTMCCDISALAFRRGSIDRVISNPPWDRQVSWSRSPQSAGSFGDMLSENFRVVLLELKGEAAKALGAGWHLLTSFPVSLRGQHPAVTVYVPAPAPVTVTIGRKRVLLSQPAGHGDENRPWRTSREASRRGA